MTHSRWPRPWVLSAAMFLLAILGPPIAFADVPIPPGNIIVANGVGGALILVDPTTGAQTVIGSGGFLGQPSGLAIDAAGHLIVADQQAFGGGGGLIRVDPVTGEQTAISSGGFFINPAAVVVDSLGQLIVTDFTSAAVIRVDPVTGMQSVISSGGFFTHPWGIAIDGAGNFVVADAGASTSGSCVSCGLIRVNAVTGAQTLISTGGFFATPSGVAVEESGDLIVADVQGFGGPGGLIRVDPITGAQSVITSGGLFSDSANITIDAAGQVVVTNRNSPVGLIGVDPVTGTQTAISSGGFFVEPVGVVVVPPTITLSATDKTATEAGPTTGAFTLARTGSTASSSTVNYTVRGTAINGTDYVALAGSRTIPAGSSTATIIVTPINDTRMEGSETVVVALSSRPAYTIGSPSSATVTIISDERVTISALDPTATEAGPTTGAFRVSRTGSTASPLTVFYSVTGTATPGTDYTALPGSVTIAAGSSAANILVRPINDTRMESNETVVVALSGRPAYTIGSPSSATVTIISNE